MTAGSGISLLFCSQTSIDFLYALYFIPVPQLGTFVGFTNLLGPALFPVVITAVIAFVRDLIPASISFVCFAFSISWLCHFITGFILSLNDFYDFHVSASALFWAAVVASSFLPGHASKDCFPSLSTCNNVGILHSLHSSSHPSLCNKPRYSFLSAPSLKCSTSIFTIFTHYCHF